MALDRMSKLGSLTAVLVVAASGGHAGVRPHCMSDADMSAMRGAASIAPATPGHHAAMHHAGGPLPEEPAQGANPNCVCAGACMDGRSPVVRGAAPAVADAGADAEESAVPAPTPLIQQDPQAYLRPLPNAPPLA